MEITPDQRRAFLEALLSAYPTRKTLERMLAFSKLGWRLDEITGAGGQMDTVFELLMHAEARSQLSELLQAAVEGNPSNSRLKDFYWSYFRANPRPAEPTPGESANDGRGVGSDETQQAPMKLVCSYTHSDSAFAIALEKHLTHLVRKGLIDRPWSEASIAPGANRRAEIQRRWNEADLIVLLVSADFLADEEEALRLVSQAIKRGVPVIPVIVRSTLWQSSAIGELEAEPRDDKKVKPLRSWAEPDEAWSRVIERIEGVIETRQAARQP